MFVFHLILSYTICFAVQDSLSALNITSDIISGGIKSNLNVYRDNLDALLEVEARSNESNVAKWFTHMEVLTKAYNKAFKNIRKNVKNIDYFDPNFRTLFDELFSDHKEYEYILQSELKKNMKYEQFDTSNENMFKLMNITIALINKVVTSNMNQMKLVMPTKWYKNLKDNILRQEIKAASGYVEKKMCDIGVCKETRLYSDYVKTWLRYLLNLKLESLREFFSFVPDSLEKHKHFVKSNIKFRKVVKYMLNSDGLTQKDYLAIFDDILDNRKVPNMIPSYAIQSATLIWLLFEIIDENYDVNDENKKELTSVTELFGKMVEGKNIYVPEILDKILENMKINNKIWPLTEQSKLDNLWAQIIH